MLLTARVAWAPTSAVPGCGGLFQQPARSLQDQVGTGSESLMKSKSYTVGILLISIASLLGLAACPSVHAQSDAAAATTAGAPPAPTVVMAPDASLFSVDHPEQFPLATATEHPTTSELVVTGSVTPDVSRNVPVVSLASGRVMTIKTRLGDTVQKGQLLMTI